MYSCDICSKVYKTHGHFKKHKCVWYCEVCCESFNFKHVYKRHIQSYKHKVQINKKKHNDTPMNVTNITNITNNITNVTNNVTNNITNNTNIVIFGNEDFSYIDNSAIQDALNTKNILPRLCRLMRNNPNRPENRNIKVTDFSREKTRIFTQQGWLPAQPIETFNNLINEASEILDIKTCNDKDDFSKPDLDKVDEITDKVHELDMAQWQGKDTKWGRENRRAIMLEFVDS